MDDYRVAVIQDFQIERARWFDDANFKTIREPGIPIMPHPDDNEEDVTIIKKHRCSNEHHCLYTFKKVLSYEAKDEFEILEAINGERFPKISLGKRKLRENDMNGSEQAISVNKRSFSEASVSVAALEEELDGFSVQADDAPNSNITVTTTTTTTTTVTTTKTSKKDKSSTTSSEK
jgi:hypothetical protein